ncbi:MAG: hypothetical protein FJW14_08930 [Acidimicrobiia bacterium]|nr:hypothetical protein [Acidimicrobiia bacterium]
MRTRSTMAVVMAVVAATSAAVAAQAQFDPRDLSGIWTIRGHRSISANVPPMTPEGEARLNANRPTRGRLLGEPLRGEHPGFVRAVPVPSQGNDPAHKCNPNGFPRLLLDPEPVEFIQTSGRLLQVFQWERTLRELWMDGRRVPSGENLANLGPAWYGHTAGAWEGNTLVMNTVGLDDRAWIDIFGFPKSTDTRIEERYTRTGPDTIELRMTLYDAKLYTQPWVSDVKTFTRVKREDVTFFGWSGLFSGLTEAICAPMNEVDTYNTLFRDRAGKGAGK